ncbi:hypothetical protein H9W90_01985 [Polaribacter pectinis]|uniref:Ig-like domain-containing protein n=1 Tax=Polaribacter pectinis TaxID=2738844 RepID=A0A7G9LBB5_9FLAO|nr:hypothetical protein [Polaribacter pectinis]QNM85914.1 hypothetical protein H9W90_01985 [Polaribacter pectinis]
MKHLFLKTALFLFALTLFSCEGNNLNTNDSTGDDTFSCLVNGKLYTPSAGTGINGGDIRPFAWAYSNLGNSNIPMFFKITSGGEYTLSLVSIEPNIGINNLNQKLDDTVDFTHSGMIILNSLIFYNTKNNQNNGTIIFTELSETKAVGTFECTLYNDNGDELKVTEGKFNLSLDSRTN